jgi:hypothetical protein
MGCDFSISPDRNWIIPGGGLKNLNTGDEPPVSTSWNCPSTIDDLPLWSPNSLYFAWLGDDIMRTKSSIEAVDGTPVSIDGKFLTWLDGNHYLYETGDDTGLKRVFIAMVNGESVEVPQGFQWTPGYVMWSPAGR